MSTVTKKEEETSERRCECGKLLLKKSTQGFEFKCNRCKRVHFLSYEQMIAQYLTIGDDAARDHESNAQTSEKGGEACN